MIVLQITLEQLHEIIESSIKKVVSEIKSFKEDHSDDEWMDTDQLALYIKLKPQTIHTYTAQKKIPYTKRLGKNLFKKSDIDQWLLNGIKITKFQLEEDAIKSIGKKKKSDP